MKISIIGYCTLVLIAKFPLNWTILNLLLKTCQTEYVCGVTTLKTLKDTKAQFFYQICEYFVWHATEARLQEV